MPKKKRIHAKNLERALWANVGVEAFMAETGLTLLDGLETAMSDLIADMMHMADVQGIQFAAIMKQARYHYEYELERPED